jgi:CDP-2,3-bis-(O-geranylgeranyl)-sn-glycerol synthase
MLASFSQLVNSLWPSTQDLVSALYVIVPAYCTNGAPVIFGGGTPIDLGKSLSDGNRILGDNKTIRGILSGLVVGAIVGAFGYYLFSKDLFLISFLASIGALFGDLVGAFLKRRLKIKPGDALPGIDQLDFVLGALLFVSPVYRLSVGAIVILIFVTPPIHFLTNVAAYFLGLKRNYW